MFHKGFEEVTRLLLESLESETNQFINREIVCTEIRLILLEVARAFFLLP